MGRHCHRCRNIRVKAVTSWMGLRVMPSNPYCTNRSSLSRVALQIRIIETTVEKHTVRILFRPPVCLYEYCSLIYIASIAIPALSWGSGFRSGRGQDQAPWSTWRYDSYSSSLFLPVLVQDSEVTTDATHIATIYHVRVLVQVLVLYCLRTLAQSLSIQPAASWHSLSLAAAGGSFHLAA